MFFFNFGYFRCTKGNNLTISGSTGEPVSMESETLRVVFLCTTEISEITRLKSNLQGRYLNSTNLFDLEIELRYDEYFCLKCLTLS